VAGDEVATMCRSENFDSYALANFKAGAIGRRDVLQTLVFHLPTLME
jgi:hypothetical protein